MIHGRSAVAGIAALACAAALAQTAGGTDRRDLEQKEALVRRLVFDSPAEQRIAASGNEEAKGELARARALHARAVALADAGDVAGAQAELNAAMWAIGKARQLVPDSAARVVDLRVRYSGHLRTVETLERSLAARIAAAGPSAPVTASGRLKAARAGIEEAKGYAATEHLARAVRGLEAAERDLMVGISATLGSDTLHYAKAFDSPPEEYAYELDRNRSYRELVPLAVSQFKPRREAVGLVERYAGENARLLEVAQGHAAAGRHRDAIEAVKAGTSNLQAALAAAGLAVPRDMGAN